jgi:hypothetical protein
MADDPVPVLDHPLHQLAERDAVGAALPDPQPDFKGQHLRHCYQGEWAGHCKYGDDDCPAAPAPQARERTTGA